MRYKEMHKDYEYVRAAIKMAFKKLRKQGYFCRASFWCCQSCACSAIPTKNEEKYVYYHKQDADVLKDKGYCYLAWGGSGREILVAINDAGLKIE